MRNFFIFNRGVSNELRKNPKMNFIIRQNLWHFPQVLNDVFTRKKKVLVSCIRKILCFRAIKKTSKLLLF